MRVVERAEPRPLRQERRNLPVAAEVLGPPQALAAAAVVRRASTEQETMAKAVAQEQGAVPEMRDLAVQVDLRGVQRVLVQMVPNMTLRHLVREGAEEAGAHQLPHATAQVVGVTEPAVAAARLGLGSVMVMAVLVGRVPKDLLSSPIPQPFLRKLPPSTLFLGYWAVGGSSRVAGY